MTRPAPAAILDALAGKLVHALQRVRDRTDDAAVHDARVATRRLAIALAVLGHDHAPRRRRRARRELRRLRRRLAAVRDAQVLRAMLAEDAVVAPAVVATAPPLATLALHDAIAAELGELEARAAKRCSPARVARLVHTLESAIAPVRHAPARDARVGAGEALRDRRDRAARALRAAARG